MYYFLAWPKFYQIYVYQVPCEGALFEFLVKYCKNAKKLTFKINEHPYSLLNTDTQTHFGKGIIKYELGRAFWLKTRAKYEHN